jgi:uncharacterized protein (DUF433 family)
MEPFQKICEICEICEICGKEREMSKEWIVSDPSIMMGKPVIAGTRITVEVILEELAAGNTVQELIEAYPRLTPIAIQAALEFAAKVLKSDVVYPMFETA